MTAEQQLERSVLEGKERDELSAIAQAMSLKTTTRTKKADIIDQILDATGVTANGNGGGSAVNGEAAERPSRRPRSAAASTDDGADVGDDYSSDSTSTAVATAADEQVSTS